MNPCLYIIKATVNIVHVHIPHMANQDCKFNFCQNIQKVYALIHITI